MDNQQAREILRLHRPGTDDAADPQTAEALRCAERDEDLGRWYQNQLAVHAAIHRKLHEIPVPRDLKREILMRGNIVRRNNIIELRRGILPLAAAAILILGAVLWTSFLHRETFADLRDRKMREVQRGYKMIASADYNQIRANLLAQNCPDYSLTTALSKLPPDGYAALDWNNHKVSMVCLKAPKNKELYLMVADVGNMRGNPAAGQKDFAHILRLNSVSWTTEGKVYILAGPQTESELKQYLD